MCFLLLQVHIHLLLDLLELLVSRVKIRIHSFARDNLPLLSGAVMVEGVVEELKELRHIRELTSFTLKLCYVL